MKELIYFSSSDVMIKTDYREKRQSIRYFSHRGLSVDERDAIESYILRQFEDVGDVKVREIKNLHYLGVDDDLSKHLHRMHEQNQQKVQLKKDAMIDQSIKDLIARSLSNYYFEQIGYALIDARRTGASAEYAVFAEVDNDALKKLVDAYNLYADKKVTLEQVLSENRHGYSNIN